MRILARQIQDIVRQVTWQFWNEMDRFCFWILDRSIWQSLARIVILFHPSFQF